MGKGIFVLALLMAVCQASSNEDFFSTVDIDLEQSEQAGANSSQRFSYRGYIKAMAKVGLDIPDQDYAFERGDKGLSVLRTDAFMEFRGEFTEHINWQLSSKAELDWIQWQEGEASWQLHRERLYLEDAYIDATYNSGVWLRAGRQVLAWGESEGLNITDILSPVDSRAPGQEQLEDLRETVPAVMVSLPFAGKVVGVLTYDAGHNIYAEQDQDFYPYIALKGLADIEHRAPENLWEYALKWERRYQGGDISVIAGDVNDNSYSVSSLTLIEEDPVLGFSQERVRVLGSTLTRVSGSWVLRGELAHYWDQPVEISPQYTWGKQDQWRGMLSAEYSGINDLTVYYELNGIYASEYAKLPGLDKFSRQKVQSGHVFRVMYEAMNARLSNQLWVLALTTDDTKVLRWDLSYDLSDNWQVASSLVIYHNNEPQSGLYPFRDNDTLNLSLTFNF